MLQDASLLRKKVATIIVFATIPISGFVTDIYLPSFPSMARELRISEAQVQFTLTIFLMSYGITQLLIGSLLDALGRYRPKLISLFLLIVSNILISNSTSIEWIYFLRALQGLFVSVIVVANRAFFVDMYKGEQLKYYLSFFTIVWSSGPILAPFFGGYLEHAFSWVANFYFLAIFSFIILLLEFYFGGETLICTKGFKLSKTLSVYGQMLRSFSFVMSILVLGLAFSVALVFNFSGPFLLEKHFNKEAIAIGYATLVIGLAWLTGGVIAKKTALIVLASKSIFASVGQLFLIFGLFLLSFYIDNFYLFLAFCFVVHVCSGLLYTIYFTESMLLFPKNAGIAGGLLGGLVYLITSLTSYFNANFGTVDTVVVFSGRYFILSAFLLLTLLVLLGNWKKTRN